MQRLNCLFGILILTFITFLGVSGYAQCPAWTAGFGAYPGVEGGLDEIVFNDGTGPALYVTCTSAGGVPTGGCARWNGNSWTPLGSGLTNGAIRTLGIFNDGHGDSLYAAGDFTVIGGVSASRIAKWNGANWAPLGLGIGNGSVYCLTVMNDGSGDALYAGGAFTYAGGQPMDYIAKWNGSAWAPIGTGTNSAIACMTPFDDGTGTALYVGGYFSAAGGSPASKIAKWDGVNWSVVGAGFGVPVTAMTVFDDGAGPQLYAGGTFLTAFGCLAHWNGTTWTSITSYVTEDITSLSVANDGTGEALYLGGKFNSMGGFPMHGIGKLTAAGWSTLGTGLGSVYGAVANFCSRVVAFNEPSGLSLFVAGGFTAAGPTPAYGIARWSANTWSSLGSGIDGWVRAMTVYDDGTGAALYAAGYFNAAGGVSAYDIAKWNGSTWRPLGGGSAAVDLMCAYNDGTGDKLYVAASGSLVCWNGVSWQTLLGPFVNISAMAVHNDGSGEALYIAGDFTSIGGISVNHIARWNGTTWSALVGGITSTFASVYSMTTFNDGSGAKLYVAGNFSVIGGVSVNNIARWDGLSWQPLGAGVGASPRLMQVFDDGTGPKLYVCGAFSVAGGQPSDSMAAWTGNAWQQFSAGGIASYAATLGVFDDGSGPALYAGGAFTDATTGGVANHIAKWNGSAWTGIGAGTNGNVYSLTVFDDGADGRPDLYVGGWFTIAGGTPTSGLAELIACAGGTSSFCFGNGTGTQCPCGNNAPPTAFTGCISSLGVGGVMSLGGNASITADTLTLLSTQMPNSSALFFQGTTQANGGNGSVFGDGLRCAGGSSIRLSTKSNVGGASQYPAVGEAPISTKGFVTAPGVRTYQCWYRNAASFCTPSTFNLTNGVQVNWSP